MEYVLRVAFESRNLIHLVEVIEADGTSLLIGVLQRVKVFASECLRDLLQRSLIGTVA